MTTPMEPIKKLSDRIREGFVDRCKDCGATGSKEIAGVLYGCPKCTDWRTLLGQVVKLEAELELKETQRASAMIRVMDLRNQAPKIDELNAQLSTAIAERDEARRERDEEARLRIVLHKEGSVARANLNAAESEFGRERRHNDMLLKRVQQTDETNLKNIARIAELEHQLREATELKPIGKEEIGMKLEEFAKIGKRIEDLEKQLYTHKAWQCEAEARLTQLAEESMCDMAEIFVLTTKLAAKSEMVGEFADFATRLVKALQSLDMEKWGRTWVSVINQAGALLAKKGGGE